MNTAIASTTLLLTVPGLLSVGYVNCFCLLLWFILVQFSDCKRCLDSVASRPFPPWELSCPPSCRRQSTYLSNINLINPPFPLIFFPIVSVPSEPIFSLVLKYSPQGGERIPAQKDIRFEFFPKGLIILSLAGEGKVSSQQRFLTLYDYMRFANLCAVLQVNMPLSPAVEEQLPLLCSGELHSPQRRCP